MSSSTNITDYLGRGTHANRPVTPGPIPAGGMAWYFETDTTNLFYWSGSAWVQANAATSVNHFVVPRQAGGWTTSGLAFACLGNGLLLNAAVTIDQVTAALLAISGHVYNCSIAAVSGTFVITSTTNVAVTAGVNGSTDLIFNFSPAITLNAAQNYIISITDTSAAAGTTNVQYLTASTLGNITPNYAGLPITLSSQFNQQMYHLASNTARIVGDTFVLDNTRAVALGLRCQGL